MSAHGVKDTPFGRRGKRLRTRSDRWISEELKLFLGARGSCLLEMGAHLHRTVPVCDGI